MSIKIIVNSQELKDKLLKESEYIHDLEYIDSDKANTLMHIYMNPDMIEVNQKEDESIKKRLRKMIDEICGKLN